MMETERKSNRTFSAMLASIVEQGQRFVAPKPPHEPLIDRCKLLVSTRGEASGTALARDILDSYDALDDDGRRAFFTGLADQFDTDPDSISQAALAYADSLDTKDYRRLLELSEPGRRELLRRLNQAPDGTAALVRMRADLFKYIKETPALARIDLDFELLLKAWFNRGFLDMVPISWNTPANLLEKISRYEAVHEIDSWEELRRRVEPRDRRCYAFFHPRMPDEPLIFVQVALTKEVPGNISDLLAADREEVPPSKASTAVFYSISNCQVGLRGISFGNFLIKQVANELSAELPQIKTFVTLSPVPGFRRWVESQRADNPLAQQVDDMTIDDNWSENPTVLREVEPIMSALTGEYFLTAKGRNNAPYDPVARFHLGNGAILDRVNFAGDLSARGLGNAYGMMVNYRYDLGRVEENHEAFANDGIIVAAKAVTDLAKQASKRKGTAG